MNTGQSERLAEARADLSKEKTRREDAVNVLEYAAQLLVLLATDMKQDKVEG